jgi:hypothetical protein
VNRLQKQQTADQDRNRDPEMHVGYDPGEQVARLIAIVGLLHYGFLEIHGK